MVQEVGGSNPLGHPGRRTASTRPSGLTGEKEQGEALSVTVTELSGFERRLTLRFEGKTLRDAENRVARRLSHHVHINGFRPGKAPRRVVERAVGRDQFRHEAAHALIDAGLWEALEEAGISPAAAPQVEEIRHEDGLVEVEVRVAVWPTLEEPPEYEGRRFELDGSAEVDPEDAQRHLEHYLDDFAELETVERPALEGDYAVLDIDSRSEGRELAAFSAADLLYELGSDGLLDGLDDSLAGRSAGDAVDFTSRLRRGGGGLEAGSPVEVRVLVKEVKERRLPDLDDDWAADFTEFDTVEELERAVYGRLEEVRLADLREQLHDKVLTELTGEMEAVIPAAVIGDRAERMLEVIELRLEGLGTDLDRYLEATGRDREEYVRWVDETAARRLYTELLLDAVAAHAGLEVEEQDLRAMYEAGAADTGRPAEELQRQLAGSSSEEAGMKDILRHKARAVLLRAVTPVDREGNVLDLGFDAIDAEAAAWARLDEQIAQAVIESEEGASDEVVLAVVESEEAASDEVARGAVELEEGASDEVARGAVEPEKPPRWRIGRWKR